MRSTLSKDEIVRGRKEVDAIFKSGSSFFIYPFRVFYLKRHHHAGRCHVLFSVPRKKVKNAVDRNRLKRRMREAYRTNKHNFVRQLQHHRISFSLALILAGDAKIPYTELENKLNQVLLRLIHVAEVKEIN